jgi:hypothetical protein
MTWTVSARNWKEFQKVMNEKLYYYELTSATAIPEGTLFSYVIKEDSEEPLTSLLVSLAREGIIDTYKKDEPL